MLGGSGHWVGEVAQPRVRLVWAAWRNDQMFITVSACTYIYRLYNISAAQVYVLWLHLIFVTLIPFSVLLWLNKTIHRKLSEGIISMRRTGHETLRKRELRLARVSLGIVLLYMVCHSPKLVPTMCEIVYGDAKVGKLRYRYFLS